MSGLLVVRLKSLLPSVFFIKTLSRGRLGCGCVSEYNIFNINLILQYANLDKEYIRHAPDECI